MGNKKKYTKTKFLISITTDMHFIILGCQKCPPETAPAPGLFYKFWTQMPNPPMRLYCIARPRNIFYYFHPHFLYELLCAIWHNFIQFKKYPWGCVAFKPVTWLKVSLLCECFSRHYLMGKKFLKDWIFDSSPEPMRIYMMKLKNDVIGFIFIFL